MNELAQAIEAILFVTSEPVKIGYLSDKLSKNEDEIKEALKILAESLQNHGINLIENSGEVTLATNSAHSALIESIKKEELQKDLSKASAETLSIIAYLQNVTKSQIEFIRGVNASYSLRALMMRGLIEQHGVGRATTYHPTVDLLNHFGIAKIEDLPQYTETKEKLEKLLVEQETE
jgi:segregation and condensation protein B